MTLFGRSSKQNWNRVSATQYSTNTTHRGYTATIDIVPTGYELTITGAGAPPPVIFSTLKLAKSAYSVFLRTK